MFSLSLFLLFLLIEHSNSLYMGHFICILSRNIFNIYRHQSSVSTIYRKISARDKRANIGGNTTINDATLILGQPTQALFEMETRDICMLKSTN